MDNILRGIPYFLQVARQKSFTLASEALDIPLSSLSRRIKDLEKSLGLQLLHRTTRSVELTESGKSFYESCDVIMSELQRTCARLTNEQRVPAGKVRLSVLADIYQVYLQGVTSAFAARYPKIEMHVHVSTRWVDLYSEPFDLEFRVGKLPDSDLKAHKLATIHPCLYASPNLLECYTAPESPKELDSFPVILQTHPGRCNLELQRKGETITISLKPVHVVNSMSIALEFALAGLGVAALLPSVAEEYVKKGKLVHLLPDWQGSGIDINVVMAGGMLSYRVRLFVDYLAAHFAKLAT